MLFPPLSLISRLSPLPLSPLSFPPLSLHIYFLFLILCFRQRCDINQQLRSCLQYALYLHGSQEEYLYIISFFFFLSLSLFPFPSSLFSFLSLLFPSCPAAPLLPSFFVDTYVQFKFDPNKIDLNIYTHSPSEFVLKTNNQHYNLIRIQKRQKQGGRGRGEEDRRERAG